MSKINSKQKGNSFERIVCRHLSCWIDESGETEYFWRSSGSGSMNTINRKKGKNKTNQEGDIVSIDASTMWLTDNIYFECKSYKQIDLIGFFLYKGKVLDWWEKCYKEAMDSVKEPMLIFKGNRTCTYLMMTTKWFNELNSYFKEGGILPHIRFKTFGHDVIVCNFNDFLLFYDWQNIKYFLEKEK
jgi:hypothetical protein